MSKKGRNELNPDEFVELSQGGEIQDDSLVLDLGGVEEDQPEFELIPAGTYDAIIENAEYKKSKASGNPMISWTFRLSQPPYEGRLMFYHTVLNKDSGLRRLKRLLLRCVPEIEMGEFKPAQFCDEGIALNRPCRIKIRVATRKNRDTGRSEPTNQITDVLGPSEEATSYLDNELE